MMAKAMKWLIVPIRAQGIPAHAWVREARYVLVPATTSVVSQNGPTLPPPESSA